MGGNQEDPVLELEQKVARRARPMVGNYLALLHQPQVDLLAVLGSTLSPTAHELMFFSSDVRVILKKCCERRLLSLWEFEHLNSAYGGWLRGWALAQPAGGLESQLQH